MLPYALYPQYETELVRIGNPYDGGYVIPEHIINNTTLLVGMGLCDDWSFEEDFKCRSNAKVLCYDHTVDRNFWIKRTLLYLVRFFLGKAKFSDIFRYLGYRRFFTTDQTFHIPQMVASRSIGGVDIDELLQKNRDDDIFFKIDIEGSEYRILSQLINPSQRVLGAVIEFHDVDIHLDKIIYFIQQSKLVLVHIHANNFSLTDNTVGPLTLELTFCKRDICFKRRNHVQYPIKGLDFPNDPTSADINLRFEAAPSKVS